MGRAAPHNLAPSNLAPSDNQAELVSPTRAPRWAKSGRSLPDQLPARLLPRQLGIPSAPTRAMPRGIRRRFLRATRRRLSVATFSESGNRGCRRERDWASPLDSLLDRILSASNRD